MSVLWTCAESRPRRLTRAALSLAVADRSGRRPVGWALSNEAGARQRRLPPENDPAPSDGRLPTRVGIVSDTHLPRGSRRIPASCLERLECCDLIVHAGDFSSLASYEELAALGPPVAAVHGNVDEAALRERLPEEGTVEAAGARIGLVHDAGPSRGRLARLQRRFPDVDAVIFGHSHIPLHEQEGAFAIFNPGSPTERRRARSHTMGLATVDEGRVRFEHVVLD